MEIQLFIIFNTNIHNKDGMTARYIAALKKDNEKIVELFGEQKTTRFNFLFKNQS